MITAFQLIFSPFETWEKISTAQRGFIWVMGVYLLPLLVIACGVEGYLLSRWGEKRGEFGFIVKVPVDLAVRYTAAYFVILLASIIVSAKFLALASDSFNVRTSYLQSFTVMAYGFGPLILVRILDGFPQVPSWLCWILGAVASISVLYHGIGMVLKPDQTKGFGLYLMSIIILVLVSGLGHFAALAVLHGKILEPRRVEDRTTSLVLTVADLQGRPLSLVRTG